MGKSLIFDYSKTAMFVSENEISNFKPAAQTALKTLLEKSGSGSDYLGWLDLPVNYDREEFEKIKQAAKKIHSDSEVLLVIGIGGSYLGARAAVEFLSHSFYNLLEADKRKFVRVQIFADRYAGRYRKCNADLCHRT